MKHIDLGQKLDVKEPGMAVADSPPVARVHYPTVHIEHHEDLGAIPDEGESIIKHKVVHRGYDKHRGQKHRHHITLEVHSIKPLHGKSKAKRTKLPDIEDDERAVDEGL